MPACPAAPKPNRLRRPGVAINAADAKAGFRTDEVQTRYEDITTYNNFYEFGTDKGDPARAAKTLRTSPWTVAVDGECAKPGRIGLKTWSAAYPPRRNASTGCAASKAGRW